MEPALDGRDDGAEFSSRPAIDRPQWSPPLTGGMTGLPQ